MMTSHFLVLLSHDGEQSCGLVVVVVSPLLVVVEVVVAAVLVLSSLQHS